MKKLFLLLALAVASHFPAVAQQGAAELARKEINQTASRIKSLQCDFVQTKHLKMLSDKFVSRGRMYYQQGNKLRWEYTAPYTYTFVLDGTKVVLRNAQRRDVIDVNRNKMFREIVRIMMNSVVGKCLSDDKSFKTSIAVSSTEYVATMLPLRKDLSQMFQKIVLRFNRKQAVVSQVELYEKNGDKTIIELKNVKTNVPLPASVFSVR
ncbi:MAG: outer membrane lipoprotein carrier protein LolA [Bacteroidaceae bacterium]|nr:outer membrane lipoprotein carrier protein LolA [Bacteroidaceae bacterium]